MKNRKHKVQRQLKKSMMLSDYVVIIYGVELFGEKERACEIIRQKYLNWCLGF